MGCPWAQSQHCQKKKSFHFESKDFYIVKQKHSTIEHFQILYTCRNESQFCCRMHIPILNSWSIESEIYNQWLLCSCKLKKDEQEGKLRHNSAFLIVLDTKWLFQAFLKGTLTLKVEQFHSLALSANGIFTAYYCNFL